LTTYTIEDTLSTEEKKKRRFSNMEKSTVKSLIRQWLIEKGLLASSRDRMIAIEERLLESGMFETVEDGSRTTPLDEYKVTIKKGNSYSLDHEKWEEVKDQIEEGLHPIKTEIKVNPSAAKFMQENYPDSWNLISDAITQKPTNPGVTIKAVENA
jgi:hypothetical protein